MKARRVLSCAVCCSLPCFVAPQYPAPPLPGTAPDWHWEELVNADGTTSVRIFFETVPGVEYTVESSADLQQWTRIEGETHYGLGQTVVVPVIERPAPPDTPPGPPPPPPAARPVVAAMQLRPATGGGLLVFWRSLDDAGPRIRHFPLLELDLAWQYVTLHAPMHEGHWFIAQHVLTPAIPPDPAGIGPFGPKDTAFLTAFEAAFDDMNQEVHDSMVRARNSPPPAPSAPGSAKFLRIRADWGMDIDQDGNLDWVEFFGQTVALADADPDLMALSNPFSADANQDGTLDSLQADSDKDGLVDMFDVAKQEKLVNWQAGPAYVYSFHPVTASESLVPETPLQIDNRARVLFGNGLWCGGNASSLGDHFLLGAMNDDGVIVGSVWPENQPGEDYVVWWDKNGGGPNTLAVGTAKARAGEGFAGNALPYADHLSADGKIVMTAWNTETGGFLRNSLWALPVNGNSPAETATGPTMWFNQEGGRVWGPILDPESMSLHGTLFAGPEGDAGLPDFLYDRLAPVPGPPSPPGQTPNPPQRRLLCGLTGPASIFGQGTWHTAPLGLDAAVDMSANGTAILRDGKFWRDGKIIEPRRLIPALPPEWWDYTVFRDSSSNGCIFAQCREPYSQATVEDAVLLPVAVRDSDYVTGLDADFATGVDDTSLRCQLPDPGLGWQDRPWVMAPQGGQNHTYVLAPAAGKPGENDGPSTGGMPVSLVPHDLGSLMPDPAILDRCPRLVSWTSPGADTVDGHCTVNLGQSPGSSPVIGVKAMKKRHLRVTVHVVAGLRPDPSSNGTIVDLPDDAVQFAFLNETTAAAAIRQKLYEVFTRQVNVWFDMQPPDPAVKVLRALTQSQGVAWDTGGHVDYGSLSATKPDPGNQSLDVATIPDGASSSDNLSFEQAKFSQRLDTTADINVFIVGGCKRIARFIYEGENATYVPTFDSGGFTNRSQRIIWIPGNADDNSPWPTDPTGEIAQIIAHEIGHVMLDYGHPDQGSGPAPLPGTNHFERLMHSSLEAKGKAHCMNRNLLVKKEWDEADTWLRNRPNGDN